MNINIVMCSAAVDMFCDDKYDFLALSIPGLARKEDFPYITYYCPHCRSLNQPKQLEERVSVSSSPDLSTLRKGTGGSAEPIINAGDSPSDDSILASNSRDGAGSEIVEVTETIASREVTS